MKTKNAALLSVLIACAISVSMPLFAETELSVSVKSGKNWETTSWLGMFPMKHTPQIAVWIEDSSGNFVKTLTVSGKSAKNKWLGAPDGGRPEALPVWLHKAKSGANEVDAASSATPKKSVELEKSGQDLTDGAEYAVFFEVNTSFDYNDAWPKSAKKRCVELFRRQRAAVHRVFGPLRRGTGFDRSACSCRHGIHRRFRRNDTAGTRRTDDRAGIGGERYALGKIKGAFG